MASWQINQLKCLLVTSLLIGCLVKMWKGALFNFTVYSLALRDTFNYTQTDINTVAILTNLGISFGFPAGILHDKYGPRWTTFVGLILTSAAYILIWSTSKSVGFYNDNAWLMKLYYFILGQGTTYSYMTAFVTNLCNFDSKYRGKIVGLLDTFSGGSPFLFALIYATCFVNGHITDDEYQNWPGYIVILIIGTTTTNALSFFLLRVRPNETGAEDKTDKANTEDSKLVQADELANRYDGTCTQTADDDSTESAAPPSTPKTWGHKIKEEWNDFKGTLCDKKYILLLILKSLVTPAAIVYNTNITAILKSAGYEQYSATMTILFPLSGMGTRVIVSIIADYFPSVASRSIILLITNTGFLIALGLLIGLSTNITVLFVTTILISSSIACVWALIPIILSDLFPVENFGRNWGLMIFVPAAFIGVYPLIFGAVYDSHTVDSSHNCYGLVCTQLTFIVTLAGTLIGIVANVILIVVIKNSKK